MTSHALARKLLELPDAPVVACDGCCDIVEIGDAQYLTGPPAEYTNPDRINLVEYRLWPIVYLYEA